MHTVDCSLLLTQDTPDALVLAILCDFRGRPEQEMVNYIVLRLRELMGEDEKGFRNYFEMLETLAENRDLQPQLEERSRKNVNRSRCHQIRLLPLGNARWFATRARTGFAARRIEKAQEIARQLLQLGVIPEAEILRITGLNAEQLAALRPQH